MEFDEFLVPCIKQEFHLSCQRALKRDLLSRTPRSGETLLQMTISRNKDNIISSARERAFESLTQANTSHDPHLLSAIKRQLQSTRDARN